MEPNQPTAQHQPYYPQSQANPNGVFGTKIPAAVAYAVGILLFFLPFVDIKCNNMSLQQVTGFQLATGFQMKENNNDSFSLGADNEKPSGTATKGEKKDPNIYAMVAMGLGLLGLLLSFTNAKAAIGGAMATGILSAAALIGLMLDIKKKIRLDVPKTGKTSSDNEFGAAFDKLGENVRITADFTPWFYVAVIAFLVAAFFSYRRMQSMR